MQQHLMQMNQNMMGGYASPTTVTTDLIQQYLDQNKQLILAILDNQNTGKVEECARNQAKLQHNLMYLAAIADSQPPQASAMAQPGTYVAAGSSSITSPAAEVEHNFTARTYVAAGSSSITSPAAEIEHNFTGTGAAVYRKDPPIFSTMNPKVHLLLILFLLPPSPPPSPSPIPLALTPLFACSRGLTLRWELEHNFTGTGDRAQFHYHWGRRAQERSTDLLHHEP
uniref:SS18 N-terminal domain-containing protein n=1 Tax=Ananas comosus var. bracteatus TaxID=296719 RepID=A0A6V7PP99_ANACO|nr:unnamed protein product [Ananas comosus var. bracteatus]